jgi:hypothetical protein
MRAEGLGCGVTAFDREDALGLLAEAVFANSEVPAVKHVTEDVDYPDARRGPRAAEHGNTERARRVVPELSLVGSRGRHRGLGQCSEMSPEAGWQPSD